MSTFLPTYVLVGIISFSFSSAEQYTLHPGTLNVLEKRRQSCSSTLLLPQRCPYRNNGLYPQNTYSFGAQTGQQVSPPRGISRCSAGLPSYAPAPYCVPMMTRFLDELFWRIVLCLGAYLVGRYPEWESGSRFRIGRVEVVYCSVATFLLSPLIMLARCVIMSRIAKSIFKHSSTLSTNLTLFFSPCIPGCKLQLLRLTVAFFSPYFLFLVSSLLHICSKVYPYCRAIILHMRSLGFERVTSRIVELGIVFPSEISILLYYTFSATRCIGDIPPSQSLATTTISRLHLRTASRLITSIPCWLIAMPSLLPTKLSVVLDSEITKTWLFSLRRLFSLRLPAIGRSTHLRT